jgi:uncharacterized LabA/DUF88 family protein
MVDDIRPQRFAVLIDADNTSPRIAAGLFDEIAKFGEASVRRIYGDFSSSRLQSWTKILQKHAIDPYQQFAYTTGKNASDIALVIDAMDLLHSGRFDGFCLVSSDSDFTRLAARIRESGLIVYGFGQRKTPKPFVAACDKFIYVENLTYPQETGQPTGPANKPRPRTSAAKLKQNAALVNQLRKAVDAASDDDGWADLGAVGNIITKQQPDFDSRTYGYAKRSELIDATTLFDLERRSPGDGKPRIIYVRDKRR